MKPILLTLAVLAALSVALTGPSAHATGSVTYYHLTVSVNGHSSTLFVPNFSGTNVITIPVSSSTLSQIQGAFGGLSSFAFPGTYNGAFIFNGQAFAVVLSSTDHFTLQFVPAQ